MWTCIKNVISKTRMESPKFKSVKKKVLVKSSCKIYSCKLQVYFCTFDHRRNCSQDCSFWYFFHYLKRSFFSEELFFSNDWNSSNKLLFFLQRVAAAAFAALFVPQQFPDRHFTKGCVLKSSGPNFLSQLWGFEMIVRVRIIRVWQVRFSRS